MKKIKVNIEWCGKNYAASVEDKAMPGVVVATNKTYEGVQKAVGEAVAFHVEGMLADGDAVPRWLTDGEYEFEWNLGTSALLRNCGKYTSLASISRVSGINERLLSHYANGVKKPSGKQRERIVESLHKIGKEFLAIM